MTLIAGFNLSNRIYLVSDTRVTFPDKTFQDNINKIVNIHGSGAWENKPSSDGNSIVVAIAGHVDFANYFTQQIRNAIKNKSLDSDIVEFEKQIESFAKEVVNNWTLTLGKNHRHATFIFGGMVNKRIGKKIDLNIFKKLFNIQFIKFKKEIEKDKPFQKTYVEKMSLPTRFKNCLQSNSSTIPVPDSHVFMLDIDTDKGISIKSAGWGEYVSAGCYSPTESDIPVELFATLEFNTDLQDYLKQGKILGDIWVKIFHHNLAGGIGGSIVTHVVDGGDKSLIIVANSILESDSRLYLNINGKKLKLLHINEFILEKQMKKNLQAEL